MHSRIHAAVSARATMGRNTESNSMAWPSGVAGQAIKVRAPVVVGSQHNGDGWIDLQ